MYFQDPSMMVRVCPNSRYIDDRIDSLLPLKHGAKAFAVDLCFCIGSGVVQKGGADVWDYAEGR